MQQFLKSTPFRIFVFVLCALLLGSVLASVSQNETAPLTKVVSIVFSPLQKAAGFLSEKAHWVSASFVSANVYRAQNEELRAQLAEYEQQLADYDAMQKKVASYEEMLGVKQEHSDFSLLSANVIGADSADLFGSLVIDKGSSDDVNVNDPVISGNYLVGIVKKVNPTSSVVLTLLNPAVNVSAIESKTRESGYVTTDARQSANGKCILAGLERNTQTAPGGLILTAGIGGIYPKGLVIGTISQVLESEVDLTDYAILTPGAQIDSLEDVCVITDFKGQGVEQIKK